MTTDAQKDYEDMRHFQKAFIDADHSNRYLKALCVRAADALETWNEPDETEQLIAELRKAAE